MPFFEKAILRSMGNRDLDSTNSANRTLYYGHVSYGVRNKNKREVI